MKVFWIFDLSECKYVCAWGWIHMVMWGSMRTEHYSRCIDILNKIKKNEHVCVWVVHLIHNVKNMLRMFSLASFFHPHFVRKYSVCIPKYVAFESSSYQSITIWWIPRMATIKRNKRSTHTMLWRKVIYTRKNHVLTKCSTHGF